MNRIKIIKKQLLMWSKDPIPEVELDIIRFDEKYPTSDIVYGDITLYFTFVGPEGTLWENKVYNGKFIFPDNFPMSPPTVKFITKIDHPNIYISSEDKGIVCISILHEGIDQTGYEHVDSRWSPCLNIQVIMRSIITLFYDPNCESPANIDASNLYTINKSMLKTIIQNDDNNV